MAQPILDVSNVVKRYGALTAVNDVSFSVEEGEIFGLLGPNGAGKSTLISMLTGVFAPDSGSIRIVGMDVVSEADTVKRLIGVVPQEIALYPTLSARENLRFFGEMYGPGGKTLQQRVDRALEMVAMTERAGDAVRTYSGGMKRRINLAIGLINNPRILFLDEPTVGVDPQSRNHIFESVEMLRREQNMSILYTTHYMEEAERLCDRVAIIDRGQIIALDTPRNLIAMLGGGILRLGFTEADATGELSNAIAALEQVRSTELQPPADGRVVLKIEANNVNEALLQTLHLLNTRSINVVSIETLEPNLESLFLHLTGTSLRP